MAETFTAKEVRRALADVCSQAGSQKVWASRHGLSPAYVNDVLHGRREPGEGIASALGLKRIVVYADARQLARQETPHGQG